MGKAVIYATGITKNTKKLAEYIAKSTGAEIFNLKEITKIDVSGFDEIIFGTGIHAGKPYEPVREFIDNNKEALADKKLFLFISCMYNDEKGDKQCETVSNEFGISDAVYFNKKAEEMNEAGFPAAVDEFIKRL